MKIKKINRAGHAGKSLQEKEAYRQFLSSRFELDKTESERQNFEVFKVEITKDLEFIKKKIKF